jgi:AcrR family transcriptional regulator
VHSTAAEPRLRTDARRNRDKLVEAAAEAFAERSAEATLDDIAKRAGVGIGTLYRHFPTREHLVEVVYRRELDTLASAAVEMLAEKAPDAALQEWMHLFVNYMAAKRGMASSLKLLFQSNSTLFEDGSTMLRQAFGNLLSRAVEAGVVKDDIATDDVLATLFSIYSIPDTPAWRDRAHRIVQLIMDGLRAR